MSAVDHDKVQGSPGRVFPDVGGAALALLSFVGKWLGFCALYRWLQDEVARSVTIRELNGLSDHSLYDIGIRRYEIDSVVDEAIKRMRACRYDPR